MIAWCDVVTQSVASDLVNSHMADTDVEALKDLVTFLKKEGLACTRLRVGRISLQLTDLVTPEEKQKREKANVPQRAFPSQEDFRARAIAEYRSLEGDPS